MRRRGARIHPDDFPNVAVRVFEAASEHETVILRRIDVRHSCQGLLRLQIRRTWSSSFDKGRMISDRAPRSGWLKPENLEVFGRDAGKHEPSVRLETEPGVVPRLA